MHDTVLPVLNHSETVVETAARQAYRRNHCKLATAPSFREFEKRVTETEDTSVLTEMLDGKDDEGFDEAIPKLSAPMRMTVRVRLADLGVLTTDDAAHSPFFILHHKLGHGGMLETARAAKDLGIKLPKLEDRWCDACIRAGLQRHPKVKVIHDRRGKLPYELVFSDIAGPFPVRSAWNGYKYVIGFICAKTHEGIIYGMHSLDEVQSCTTTYLSWVRGQRIRGEVEVVRARDGVYDPIGIHYASN